MSMSHPGPSSLRQRVRKSKGSDLSHQRAALNPNRASYPPGNGTGSDSGKE